MSQIKSGGLNQYGAGPFEQQQFGPAGVERVKLINAIMTICCGPLSTGQRAVMLCGWGVKAGMVHVWVSGKTVSNHGLLYAISYASI